jgi:hypothetical protein
MTLAIKRERQAEGTWATLRGARSAGGRSMIQPQDEGEE